MGCLICWVIPIVVTLWMQYSRERFNQVSPIPLPHLHPTYPKLTLVKRAQRSSQSNPINPTRPQNKPKDWASLFNAQCPSKAMKLDHYPELRKSKSPIIILDETHVDDRNWGCCLLGYFLDGRMPLALLSSTARAVWKEHGQIKVKQLGACFLFEFQDEATKRRVLESGPYFFSRRYLVLKDWRRMLVPSTEHPSTIPAWIKIHKLPLECWTEDGFSRIASAIGKPLYVDKATERQQRLDFARVCVEIDAADDHPTEIQISLNGESVVVALEYQWMPPVCQICKVFGHSCSPIVGKNSIDTPQVTKTKDSKEE